MSVNSLERLTTAVAVPVCGQAEFISSAIKSLVAQTDRVNVAVLDATPDNSVQRILRKSHELRLDYVRHGPDDGQTAAIQEGWDHLDGEILHWLNADDYLLPFAIEAVMAVFESRPDIDVVYGDAVFVDRGGTFTGYFPAISGNPRDLLRTCCIAQPACFVRRRAIEQIGGLDRSLHYIMDWDLWTRLYAAGAKFHYLPKPLACVRMYPETKTGSGAVRRFEEIREHLRRHAGAVDRLRSMAAFKASSGATTDSLELKGLRYAKQAYRLWMRWLAYSGLGPPLRELYGLETATNRVKTRAEIWLPWYGDRPPRELVVAARGNRELKAEINGFAASVVQEPDAGSGQTVFRWPQELPNEMVLTITLYDRVSPEWRLISAHLN